MREPRGTSSFESTIVDQEMMKGDVETQATEERTRLNRRQRIAQAIASTAPKLAEALGGPLAGAATQLIARAILKKSPALSGAEGVEVSDQFDEIPPILLDDYLYQKSRNLTAQDLLALQQAEVTFNQSFWQAKYDSESLAVADRKNARARQKEMRDITPSVLGSLVILGFFVVLAVMVTQNLPKGSESEFSIMLGALATMTAAVVNYFFGSSAGSREKTTILEKLNRR